MLRRISTKWILAVLAAVVVPFVGFAWYVNGQLSARLWDVVRYYLQSIAADLSLQIDRELAERWRDMDVWAASPIAEWAVADPDPTLVATLQNAFDRYVPASGIYDLLLAIDAEGSVVASNTVDAEGKKFPRAVLRPLGERSFAAEPWFQEAMRSGRAGVDQHLNVLLPPKNDSPGPHPENYAIGLAVRVEDSKSNGEGHPLGVIYGVVNWRRFQYGILKPTRREYFQGLIGPDIYASSYAWLWKSDADTIIGHPMRELYGKKVSEEPIGLPQLVEAARDHEFGMYPEYEFRGVRKNAAFKHCKGPEEGGFGWVVGIGIDNDDIYATVNELDRVLRTATFAVLGVVVLWTVIIARRTTRPILELERHTRLVSRGDLETRIPVRSNDELGQLARAFNRMTAELAQSRERLVKAEKDAAWREMARQVAHEIKNPLTPIQLSVNLLRRAHEEGSPEFGEILERTTELIQRQVESMRAIARDFYAFAGAAEPKLEAVDVLALVAEVIELNGAWASEIGVNVETRGPGGTAYADRGELRRILINLASNALEAMPDGGTLTFLVRPDAGRVRIEVTDTGHGLSEEVRERLFEPYFTTRSHGTGLGLAICRRLAEEMNGEIALENVERGGTRAVVLLPEAPAA